MVFDPLNIPKLEKHVSDFSHVLSEKEREALSLKLSTHESDTTEQVVVIFIPHRGGHELLDIGLKLFNENGVGKKGLNNGLMLIIATEEKKIRIITGKGMEIAYSEMRCRDIVENHLRPLLNNENYRELISIFIDIVTGIKKDDPKEIQKHTQGQEKTKNDQKIEPYTVIILVWVIMSMTQGLLYILLIFPIIISTFKICGFIKNKFSFSLNKSILISFLISLFLVHGGISMYCSYNPISCQNIRSSIISNSNNGHQSTSPSSHHSPSSSFGGGGGSSNGGGYGD